VPQIPAVFVHELGESYTKVDRINQEKQNNKKKNCFPFKIYFFFFSVFFMQDVESVVISARLLQLVKRNASHRRLDIRSPNKK
jgi:hypothetical protein